MTHDYMIVFVEDWPLQRKGKSVWVADVVVSSKIYGPLESNEEARLEDSETSVPFNAIVRSCVRVNDKYDSPLKMNFRQRIALLLYHRDVWALVADTRRRKLEQRACNPFSSIERSKQLLCDYHVFYL